MSSTKAIIFDLDETLYRERRFVLSGFAAVARSLEKQLGFPRDQSFRILVGAMREGQRATALQRLCRTYRLREDIVPRLVDVIRAHRPRLRMPRETRAVLEALRPDWRIAILTNGVPAVQARKVRALGLAPLVEHVVFACEHSETGKPDRTVFMEALHRLGTHEAETVFVGDDPWCDIAGARRVGLPTIRIHRGGPVIAPVAPASEADVVVRRLDEVPAAATRLVIQAQANPADYAVGIRVAGAA